jgi:hypothetical protein
MILEEEHMDKAAVQQSLVKVGLTHLTEHIDQLVRNSIRLHTKPADEAPIFYCPDPPGRVTSLRYPETFPPQRAALVLLCLSAGYLWR